MASGPSKLLAAYALTFRHLSGIVLSIFVEEPRFMILVANILKALAVLVELTSGALTVYKYILIASALISWVNPDPYNPIVSFLRRVTEPLLSRIRRLMPDTGMLDLSPLVAFALIYLIQIVVLDTLYQYLFKLSFSLRLG